MAIAAHEVLKEIRQQFQLTQSEVARYLDMSQNNYSRIESGAVVLTLPLLRQLATLYRQTVVELTARLETGNASGAIDALPKLPPSAEERIEKLQQTLQSRITQLEKELADCRLELVQVQKKHIQALEELAALKG